MTTTPQTELQQLAAHILTDAVEAGIAYWACVDKIERSNDYDILSVVVHPLADEDVEPGDPRVIEGSVQMGIYGRVSSGFYQSDGIPINFYSIIAAIKRIIDEDIEYVGQHIKERAMRWLVMPEDADYDSGDADIVVQVAVLGKVVFG